MNIEAISGTKVLYTGKGGYNSDKEYANKFLNVGQIYVVNTTIIHSYSTDVILEEFPEELFNSVHFDDLAEEHTSEIIDSLNTVEPNKSDYCDDNGDGSIDDYVDALLLYIDRLKKDHKINVEMLTKALNEDNEKIKAFEEWIANQPLWRD